MADSILFDASSSTANTNFYSPQTSDAQKDDLQFYSGASDYGQQQQRSLYDPSSYYAPPPVAASGDMTMDGGYTDSSVHGFWSAFGTTGFPGEAPLLEELGVNFYHIKDKVRGESPPPIPTPLKGDSCWRFVLIESDGLDSIPIDSTFCHGWHRPCWTFALSLLVWIGFDAIRQSAFWLHLWRGRIGRGVNLPFTEHDVSASRRWLGSDGKCAWLLSFTHGHA